MRKVRILSFVLIIAISLCFAGCKQENPWIPKVQGSHVREMPYEDIDGEFIVEKYADFKSFKKSALANYNFIKQRVAKEERYSAEYFKTRDLAVIKFNYPESEIKFTVADVVEQGSECVVKLLPMPESYPEKQETTYYCFIETQNDISGKNYRLEFLDEVIRDSLGISLSYITEDNLPYLFDEDAPVAFKLSSPDAVMEFIEYDEILTEYNFVRATLTILFNNRTDDKELLLVRTASNDFETLVGSFDGIEDGVVKITGMKTNHYMFGWEKGSDISMLVAFRVPKGFVPDSIERLQYNEYEDEFTPEQKFVGNSYTLQKTTNITDNLTRFDFE